MAEENEADSLELEINFTSVTGDLVPLTPEAVAVLARLQASLRAATGEGSKITRVTDKDLDELLNGEGGSQ
jgi:hypothetical protein